MAALAGAAAFRLVSCAEDERMFQISPSCGSSLVGTSALAVGASFPNICSHLRRSCNAAALPSAALCFSALKKRNATPENVHSSSNALSLRVLHAGDTVRLLRPKVKNAASFIF